MYRRQHGAAVSQCLWLCLTIQFITCQTKCFQAGELAQTRWYRPCKQAAKNQHTRGKHVRLDLLLLKRFFQVQCNDIGTSLQRAGNII